MTASEPDPTETIESALDQIGRATGIHELERAWVEGLCLHSSSSARDRILAQAGTRLRLLDDTADQWLRRCWLRQVADEVQRRGDQPLGDALVGITRSEIREAFAHADADLSRLRSLLSAGEDIGTVTERHVQPTMRVRDLGRIVGRMRGCGLTALAAKDDVELARSVADALLPPARLAAVVPEFWRVTRDDLIRWSAPLDARGELPRLVRGLIAETTTTDRIDFPAGTAVSNPGWDGVVECQRGNQFVPSGRSVWELSAGQSNPDHKARNDYEKRVQDTPPDARHETAYVALTCAKWPQARTFEDEKSPCGDFRSVRALNVDNLEDWLECAPMATVWLREQMGEPASRAETLSAWWRRWLNSTTVPLDGGVVLAGREARAQQLRGRLLLQNGSVVTVGGPLHRDEIVAFVAAALCASDGSEQIPTEVLYIDDHDTARQLLVTAVPADSTSPNTRRATTVVVPSVEFAAHLPPGTSHQIIVPVPGSDQADIKLEAVDSDVAAQRLGGAVKDLHTAHELAGLARMSLLALRRHLAVRPELHRPGWASGPMPSTLRRSLLLGGWEESREGDTQVVEELTGQEYEAVADALRQLDRGDAPIITTGDQWHAVAHSDTWALLAHHLTRQDITKLCEIASRVLIEPDPLHGLADDELMLARFDGTRARYSPSLKRGIAATLGLLGACPPRLHGTTTPNSSIASDIVWTLLNYANEDQSTKTWAVVVEVLPLLAEAAPEQVLGALRTCLSEPHEFATAMFADKDLGSFSASPSPHLQVLNALEVIAWSPDHLLAVTDLLARLAEIDPGGRYANRPDHSLAAIMCTWKPHTAASADERLAAVRMLRQHHNSVAWPLMLSMLPDGRRSQVRKQRPRFRDWSQQGCVVTQDERTRATASISDMLLEDVGCDPGRWTDLLGVVETLPKGIRSRVIDTLCRVAASGPDETFKSGVFTELRTLVNNHREHRSALWALAESELAALDDVLDRLRPDGRTFLYGDLFSPGLSYIDGIGAIDGRDAFEAALNTKQIEAVELILAEGGLKAVLAFAMEVEQPGLVGVALARVKPHLDAPMLDEMLNAPAAVTSVALGYFEYRFSEIGWEGVDELLANHEMSPQVVADLHRAVPAAETPWDRVEAHGSEVADAYWTRVNYFNVRVRSDLRELLVVSRRLRQARRIELALTLLEGVARAHESDPGFAEEVATCLEQWIRNEVSEASPQGKVVGKQLVSLIKVLDCHREQLGVGRLARIEWLLYPLLGHDPSIRVSSLYSALTEDPDFFVWLVELAYKPANASPGDPPESTETDRRIALNADRVLHAWPASRFAPGADEDGRVDAASLNQWVDNVRTRLAEIDRANIGDRMIGMALAASPADPDGESPGKAVRDLIERLQSDDVDSGISEAMLIQDGHGSRSPTDGGTIERSLAQSYRERARRVGGSLRTAAIYRRLASSFEQIASFQDRRAELHRRGLPA